MYFQMLVDETSIIHSVVITEVRMAALKASRKEKESKSGDKERKRGENNGCIGVRKRCEKGGMTSHLVFCCGLLFLL